MKHERTGTHAATRWNMVFILTLLFVAAGVRFTVPNANSTHTGIKTARTITPLTEAARQRAARAYHSLPLSFEPNRGQADPAVQFLARGQGYTLLLARDEAVVAFEGQEQTDRITAFLQNMDPKKRERFEKSKYFRLSPRFRQVRKSESVGIVMKGASPDPAVEALGLLPGTSNYFIGNDPHKWRTGIPSYARVRYRQVYPGIDLVYYGNRQHPEFDFVLAPGADPSVIDLLVDAKGPLHVDGDGNATVETRDGSFELFRPRVFQTANGTEQPLRGGFVLRGKHDIGFHLAAYDHRRALTIDPTLSYSTYFGGNGTDTGESIAVDSSGDMYIAGTTTSTDFPIASGYQTTLSGTSDAFVSELDPTGTMLEYSTYLGGSGDQTGAALAIDPAENAYITGTTTSSDFPIVNGFQTTLGSPNGNAFVARIDTTVAGAASLVYSTYLGGGGNSSNSFGDAGFGIAVGASETAYITGQTTSDASVKSFPTTSGAYQLTLNSPNGNAFLTVLITKMAGASSLLYSTYLGGNGTGIYGDYGIAVAVNSSGDAFLTGQTTSNSPTPFPTTSGAFQTSLNGTDGNMFVTELNNKALSRTAQLVYSTYLGGTDTNPNDPGDEGDGIVVNSSGDIYITGGASSSNFPTTVGAYQSSNSSEGKAVIAELNPALSGSSSLVYSTFLGGSGGDVANSIAVDVYGNAYIAGATGSSNFPILGNLTTLESSDFDGFFTEMNPTGTALVYSTYLGGSCAQGDSASGIALDSTDDVFVSGETCSTNFPVSSAPNTPYQSTLAGTQNAFITEFAAAGGPAGQTFAFSPATGSACPSGGNCSTSATVSAGQTATYNLQIGPVNGFNGTVALGCADSLRESTCTVSPASVAVNGTAAAFSVTVTTTAGSAIGPFSMPRMGRLGTRPLLILCLFSALALFIVGSIAAASQRKGRMFPIFALLIFALLPLAGCAATGSNGQNFGTRSGTVTVTGTSNGVSQSASLNLTIN